MEFSCDENIYGAGEIEIGEEESLEKNYETQAIYMHQLSEINMSSEVDKGNVVASQQELWLKLCECRIKIQRVLLAANKILQIESLFNQIDLKRVRRQMQILFNNFVGLQTGFMKSNILAAELEKEKDMQGSEENLSKEFSDSDNGEEEMPESKVYKPLKSAKRKCSEKHYNEVMAKRHKVLETYRNSVIQVWDRKTKLTSGHISQKSFNMFDQTSVIDQIEQIIQKRSIRKKGYDREIFDDEDFYRQLLKDIIESKSVGMDPVIFSKQLEIQRVRRKMKRNVDSKASKERKIRDELFHSLMGQHRT